MALRSPKESVRDQVSLPPGDDGARPRKRGGDAVVRKADRKLGHVADLLVAALGPACFLSSEGLMEREVSFGGIPEFSILHLSYETRNKLFATLFDLVYRFEVPGKAEGGSTVRYDSSTRSFNGGCSMAEQADALSNELVFKRIDALGITEVSAEYSAERNMWLVRMQGLVGSSTWNLLPPVLQLIEPRLEECLMAVELARMIAAALRA